jgi:hypothetical protein
MITMAAWDRPAAGSVQARRLDPEYFNPRVVTVAEALAERGCRRLQDLVRGAWRGVSPRYDPRGDIRVVKTANVQRFEITGTPFSHVHRIEYPNEAIVPPGSLLITSTGVGSAGRSFAFFGIEDLIADAHVAVLPLRCSAVDGAYACAFLQSPVGRQQLLRSHRGSSRQIEIYPEDLLAVPIRWPDRAAREHIAGQWLAAVRAIDAARTSVRSAESLIESYAGTGPGDFGQAPRGSWEIMAEVLHRGGFRLDPEYGEPGVVRLRAALERVSGIRLSEAIRDVRKGVQPDSYDPGGDLTVVKSRNVSYPDFNLAACERAFREGTGRERTGRDRTGAERPRRGEAGLLHPGDVLVNMTGEGTLGRATVVPDLAPGDAVIAAFDLAVVRAEENLILPEFLALFLNSWMGRLQTRALQTGSSGQQHLYPAHFAEIVIPLRRNGDGEADLGWQREVVDLAQRRSRASRRAIETGERLDKWFRDDIGVPVDLSTIPR